MTTKLVAAPRTPSLPSMCSGTIMRLLPLLLALLLLPTAGRSADPWPSARPDYPQPEDDGRLLFFLQRSMNPNTVVYAAHLDADGRLDATTPVRVYWRRFNTDGKRRALNFVERHFAYGVSAAAPDEHAGAYRITVAGLEARPIEVRVDAGGQPRAFLPIAGRRARLRSVYLELDGDGFLARVAAVRLFGTDPADGSPRHERFVPE